jgi:hypothetical protein
VIRNAWLFYYALHLVFKSIYGGYGIAPKNQDTHISEQGAVWPAHKKMGAHVFLQASEMQINITKHLSLNGAA